jgi:hypothetical protein
MRKGEPFCPALYGQHVCVQHSDGAARDRLLSRAVHEGVARGCRVVCLCADEAIDGFARDLVVDPWMAASLANGTIELRIADQAYLPDGAFDGEALLDLRAAEHDAALAAGYRGLWMPGDLAWAIRRPELLDDIVAYEHKVSAREPDPTLTSLCFYDQRWFSEALLADIALAHPTTVVV